MSIFATLLIVLAVVLPALVLIVYVHRYIHRHAHPDIARLRFFRGLLRFIAALLAAYLVVGVILFTNGIYPRSATDSLLPLASSGFVVTCIAINIQRCQKKLRKP